MVTAVVNGSMNGVCLTGRFSGSFLRDWNESIVIETIGMSDRIGEFPLVMLFAADGCDRCSIR
jgi:hypothetical protein